MKCSIENKWVFNFDEQVITIQTTENIYELLNNKNIFIGVFI